MSESSRDVLMVRRQNVQVWKNFGALVSVGFIQMLLAFTSLLYLKSRREANVVTKSFSEIKVCVAVFTHFTD